MRNLTIVVVFIAACGAAPSRAFADPADAVSFTVAGCAINAPRGSVWAVDFSAGPPAPAPSPLRLLDVDQTQPARRSVPVEYSEGYNTRAKIHKISSYATLPLFVANYFVGQHLYDHPGDESMSGAHSGLVAGTAVLFGANTVTGVWNIWEGRKDPNHRTKRITHGILMIVADVGFLATAALAPESEHEGTRTMSWDNGRSPSTHRAVALTSMGIATVGYLLMLFGSR